MIRLTIVSLASILAAAPLLADARIAPAAGPAPAEKVNWNNGLQYTYDGSGNVRQIDKDRFVYDKAGRLVQADVNGVTRVYTYDAFGNRTGCTHAPETTEVSDCQFGQSIDSTTNRVENLNYDDAGNIRTYQGHTYTYDILNMPVRDDSGGGMAKEFVYTADDERIATHLVGSSWTWTIRDVNGKVLREFASNAQGAFTWTRDYVYRDGLLLASVRRTGIGAAREHYHLDHLGTPRRVTNQNNRIIGFHDYYAFGPEVSGGLTEPAATPLQYTGHERDKWLTDGPDTLDYMHARYYSPALGRFLSIDPVLGDQRDPQSWNRYAYTRNNPMSRTDPFGLADKGPPCFEKRGDKPCGEEPEPKKSSTATAETEQSAEGEKMTFFGKREYSNRMAAWLNSVPDNTILINSHGTSSKVNGMTAQELADKIRADSQIWRPGTAIILNSCNSARGDDSIAEELSKIMQTSVTGNDQPTWTFGVDLGTWGTWGANGGQKREGWPDFTTRGNQVTFVNGVRQQEKDEIRPLPWD